MKTYILHTTNNIFNTAKIQCTTFISLTFCILLMSFNIQQSSLPSGLFNAIRAGDAKALANYFNTDVELIIIEKDGVYSKLQAEQIIKDFFLKNVPGRFVKNHEGGKDESRYGIGTLNTSTGQYRISFFLMKTVTGEYLIDKFIIEDDNN